MPEAEDTRITSLSEQQQKESEKTNLDFQKTFQEELNLTERQIEELKEKGVDLSYLKPEDLADEQKRKLLFKKLKTIEGLSEEQREKIEEIEKMVDQPEPTAAQIESLIKEKRKEIEESTELSQEEKRKMLNQLSQMEKTLEEEIPQDFTQKKSKREKLIKQLPAYVKYAGIGLGLLFFIFLWKRLITPKE